MDWDENDTEIIEDILPSRVGDLCYVLWNRRKIKSVRESLKKLPWRDQMILKVRKRCLYLHIPKHKNPHSRSSGKGGKTVGFSNAAFIEPGEIHVSRNAATSDTHIHTDNKS